MPTTNILNEKMLKVLPLNMEQGQEIHHHTSIEHYNGKGPAQGHKINH